MNGHGKAGFVALTMLLVSFVTGELALRAYQRVVYGIPFTALLPGAPEHLFELSPFLVFGPRIDRTFANKAHPELATYNAQGFRTKETLGHKPAGELRIIALGGSTTEDLWNAEGIHWPWVLEQELHERGMSQVRVYNSANSAYSTAHDVVRLAFDVPTFEPDYVLVMHNINDLTVTYYAAREGKPVDAHYRVKYAIDRYTGVIRENDVVLSRFWRLLRDRLERLLPDEPPPDPEDYDLAAGKAIFERNLLTLAALAKAHGIEPIFLTMPFTDSRELYDEMRIVGRLGNTDPIVAQGRLLADLAEFNRSVAKAGAQGGAIVIDMAAKLGTDPKLFSDVVHYTADGSRAFGEALAEELMPRLAAR
jgi:lysophospholipase L1-like esterase